MKTKYKKITVAVHTAIMTSLICSALPSFASDTELYKAPQSSETTIMFMMDVSGSMNFCDDGRNTPSASLCTGGRTKRIDLLKRGMINLLQGTADIEPLADKLVVGLSEFGGTTGRIKLEARPLGETTQLPGTRPLFQENQNYSRNVSRIITETKQNTIKQTRTVTAIRSRDCRWCSWDYNRTNETSWSPSTISTSGGTWTANNPNWVNQTSGTAISEIFDPKECIAWSNNSPYTCSQWEQTVKSHSDFGNVTSSSSESNHSYSDHVNGTPTPQVDGNINYSTVSWDSNSWNCNSNNICTRIEARNASISSTRTYTQTATQTYKLNTVYSGIASETHRKKMIRAINALDPADGTPTAFAYAEVAAYMMGQKTSGNFTGFRANVAGISNSTNYIAPTSVNKDKQCNTQGIYFLTDGVPEYGATNRSSQSMMSTTLEGTPAFACSSTYLGGNGPYYPGSNGNNNTNNWTCIGDYTKRLLDGGSSNPAGVSIKTAVVGFGDVMAGKVSVNSWNKDVAEAKRWGELGGGGFYEGTNDKDIEESVVAFLKKLQKYIPPVTTGSVTVPVDNLDTQNIQPWGYFPQFDPQPDSRVTTWIGNLKKYKVVNNVLRDRNNGKVVDEESGVSVDSPEDYWADTSIKKMITKIKTVNNVEIEEDIEVLVGGALSQLKLGMNNNVERKIFTDRKITEDGQVTTVSNNSNLLQIKTSDLKVLNNVNNYAKDPKRGYIAALFGYDVASALANQLASNVNGAQTTFSNFLTNANATLRQMGAVMHSKPILITQEGKTKFDTQTGDLTYINRDDLIVFGTTQGLLHIVRAGDGGSDSDAGKEVFTFVPNEMIENQYQGFLNQLQQGNLLKYGIDGQWTAYTEYATQSGSSANEPVVSVKNGKQWLYGGLRMGGRSYYALDLSDVTSSGGTPKIKFRIDPQSAAAYSPLSYMGQSWSKPTITWVNWKGTRKLVMIVGGGYDDAYENLNFRPSSSTDKGAGVYVFDAEDGSLLWWASAHVDESAASSDSLHVVNMKRSVVSQIKAIDRNNDGLADHLYFGDLGGQLWRVDLDSSKSAGESTNFAKRAVRIMDMSTASNVPRFYSTPTFSVHNEGNGLFGVVTIGSGNLSFPMSEADQSDALYVVYDKDVTKRNLPVMSDSELTTVDVSVSGSGGNKLVENADGNTATTLTYGGWYYPLANKNRILNDNVVIANDLYTSVFDATVDIDDVNCYGGVRGKSVAKQFCLPYGQCLKKNADGSYEQESRPDDIELGKGNIGISFGGIDKKRGLVLNLPTDKTLKTYQGKTKFISQRWYER